MDATKNPTPAPIFTLTAEERDTVFNGTVYEQFTRAMYYGEEVIVPVRPGIVAEYIEDNIGYYIQQVEGSGFRWISVEHGEDDQFGPFFSTKRTAIQDAVRDWQDFGQGESWAQWSRQMAKDAVAPERIEVSALAELISSEAGDELSAKTIFALSFKIAELVNNS